MTNARDLPETDETLELLPIGTGKGATAVYHGEPSSSFAILRGGRCVLLVDVGLGVTRAYLDRCGELPATIFVTHNHSDHSGELPVILAVEGAKGRKPRVVAGPEVLDRLKRHRVHELLSTGAAVEDLAEWVEAPAGEVVLIDDRLSLVTRRGQHSEISYGFVLRDRGVPVLGFTADSGFVEAFFDGLATAPVVVADGRAKGSAEHASFRELASWAEGRPGVRLYVTGYGRATEASDRPTPLRPGEAIRLD